MKKLIKKVFVYAISMFVVSLIITSFQLSGGALTYLMAAGILTILNFAVKPVLNVLFLPITILTLGVFKWVIGAITLWGADKFVDGLVINSFSFPGLSYNGFVIPATNFGYFSTLLISSLLISLISAAIEWVAD